MRKERKGCGIPLISIGIIVMGIAFFLGATIYIISDRKAERGNHIRKSESNYAGARHDYIVPHFADDSAEETDDVPDTAGQEIRATTPEPICQDVLSTAQTPSNATVKAAKKPRQRTAYEQGYWDGYECGYDDGDQNAGYGFSWYCDGKSDEYVAGFRKGYPSGYAEGIEDYEAFHDEY